MAIAPSVFQLAGFSNLRRRLAAALAPNLFLFGLAYGVLIKELRLLARAIFVLDKNDVVRYVELVPEATTPPDYDAALGAARKLL